MQVEESEADEAGGLKLLALMGKCFKVTDFFLSHGSQNIILDIFGHFTVLDTIGHSS